jgi:hypothetical protein
MRCSPCCGQPVAVASRSSAARTSSRRHRLDNHMDGEHGSPSKGRRLSDHEKPAQAERKRRSDFLLRQRRIGRIEPRQIRSARCNCHARCWGAILIVGGRFIQSVCLVAAVGADFYILFLAIKNIADGKGVALLIGWFILTSVLWTVLGWIFVAGSFVYVGGLRLASPRRYERWMLEH